MRAWQLPRLTAAALALGAAAIAACSGDGDWFDTRPDPDLSYLPLGTAAYSEDSFAWSEGARSADVDAYVPLEGRAPVVLMLPGAMVTSDRYRWMGATLASHGVATLIVQPDTAFASSAHVLATLAAVDRQPWSDRIDLDRLVLAGHSAGGVAAVGLTDVSACPVGFCAPTDTTPLGLRGLILLGYHNLDGVDDDAPMAAAEVPWLLVSGTRDGLATPAKVEATVARIEDRPLHWIEIEGANHFQLTDYVDPQVDLRLPDDLEPTIGNRNARATAATYLVAFVERYLLDDASVPGDLAADGDERVIATTLAPRIALPPVPGMSRIHSEPTELVGLTDDRAAGHADVVATAVLRGERYLLVRNAVTGAQVFRVTGDGNAVRVPMPGDAPGGFDGNPRLDGLLGAMVVWKDELYVGVTSGAQGAALASTGAEVWAWNGERWRPVISRRADPDLEIDIAAASGCAAGDGDPEATLRVAGASWSPGAWVGALIDDVDHPIDAAHPLVWQVVDSGIDTLVVQANDIAGQPEDTVCAGQLVGARLSLRTGADESGFGEPWNKGIAAMAVYGDRLYVGTAFNYEDGAELWVTADGATFTIAIPRTTFGRHATGMPITTSISSLGVADLGQGPTLFVGGTGSEGYGARLYALRDGAPLRAVIDDSVDADDVGLDEAGMGSGNQQVSSITAWNGRVWIATMNFTGLEVLSSGDGVSFRRDVGEDAPVPRGWGDRAQLAARLVVVGDELWAIDAAFVQSAGELRDKSGAAVRTRDGVRWQQVTAHAFGTNAVQISNVFSVGERMFAISSGAALAQPLIFRPLHAYTLIDEEEERP